MPKVMLALGPIVFRDFELPPEIKFGGRQRLVIHRLGDGQRVIDLLGRDDADIRFSGVLSGPDATSRAQLLDRLRGSGILLPLSWDAFFYSAAVAEFTASYRNSAWIPYTIRCVILRDEAASFPTTPASLGQLLLDDINTASDGAPAMGMDFATISSALLLPGAATPGSAAYRSAQQSLSSASATLHLQIGRSEQQLSEVDASPGSARDAIAAFSEGTAIAQQLAWLTNAQGYIGRALVNMTLAAGAA